MANIRQGYYESYLKVLKHGLQIYSESGNMFKDFGNNIYDMLTTVGALKLSKDEKNKVLDDTKLKILSEANAATTEEKRVYLMSIVDDTMNEKMHPDLIAAVKREIFSQKIKSVIESKSTEEFTSEVENKIKDFFTIKN